MKTVARALTVVFCSLFGAASAEAEPIVITMATATPGGGFTEYGNAVAGVLNAASDTLKIRTENTGGSEENIGLLERGAFDIGLVAGVPAYEAFQGIGREKSKLKIIAATYSNPGFFAVRGDSSVSSIRDLVGRPVAWGTKASGHTLTAKYITEALGLDRDRDFEAVYLEKAGDGPGLLLEGQVDAFWGGGIGWPGFTKVIQSGGRFVGFTEDQTAAVVKANPFLKPMTVPANSYPNQAEPVQAIGTWAYILARPDLPEATAYAFAKALAESHSELVKALPRAEETTPANTRAAADPANLHPGVARYLSEAGI